MSTSFRDNYSVPLFPYASDDSGGRIEVGGNEYCMWKVVPGPIGNKTLPT